MDRKCHKQSSFGVYPSLSGTHMFLHASVSHVSTFLIYFTAHVSLHALPHSLPYPLSSHYAIYVILVSNSLPL